MVRNALQKILCTGLTGLAGFVLAGCVESQSTTRVHTPPPTITPAPIALPKPSATSLSLMAHYNRIQNDRLRHGRLREDDGRSEGPLSRHQIARNFLKVALHHEIVGNNSASTETTLSRWQDPIRMSIEFGPSVTAEARSHDRTETRAFAKRLARLTRHPISETSAQNANFRVIFLSEDDRRAMHGEFNDIFLNAENGMAHFATNLPKNVFCFARQFEDPHSNAIKQTVVMIRAEHPDLLRKSCIHEELAQGMGLYNDADDVRPSIFNDDDEFALLTRHDEFLLRILYDPRLQTGMSKPEAKAVLPSILDDLLGTSS